MKGNGIGTAQIVVAARILLARSFTTRAQSKFAPAILLNALGRLDQAETTIQRAFEGKLQGPYLNVLLYAIAFLKDGKTGKAEQQQWFASTPESENYNGP